MLYKTYSSDAARRREGEGIEGEGRYDHYLTSLHFADLVRPMEGKKSAQKERKDLIPPIMPDQGGEEG